MATSGGEASTEVSEISGNEKAVVSGDKGSNQIYL